MHEALYGYFLTTDWNHFFMCCSLLS